MQRNALPCQVSTFVFSTVSKFSQTSALMEAVMDTKKPVATAVMLILQLGEKKTIGQKIDHEQNLAVTHSPHVCFYELYVLTLPPTGDKFNQIQEKSVCKLLNGKKKKSAKGDAFDSLIHHVAVMTQ